MSRSDGIIRDAAEVVVPEILQQAVGFRIRLLQIASYKAFEQTVTGFGTAPRYFGLLKLVEANPGIPQTRLAEAVFLDRSSLVPILEALSGDGWVERRPAERDRRVRQVFLTEEGAIRLGRLEREVTAHETALTRGLTPEERATLLSLLARVDANLRHAPAAG